MDSTQRDEPAFPSLSGQRKAIGELSFAEFTSEKPGLTKRELIAAISLHGLRTVIGCALTSKTIAETSVADADALLQELSKS